MGSMITLGIDRFEIDWGKNNRFIDHSCLFLPTDVAQIPYYDSEGTVEKKEGFSRKLNSIKSRLDLLGYSLNSLKTKYQEEIELVPYYYPDVNITFDQYKKIITKINIQKVELDEENADYNIGEFISRYIFCDPEIKKHLPEGIKIDSDLGAFFENLDPYITLRLLAENDTNSDSLVQWRYTDVVEGGWVTQDEIVKPLNSESKVLVVTEGSSDSYIIERVLKELRPDIADFFNFIDMEEHYPFTGTGNLFKFCQGLSRINIQNQILVVFDNDTAGVEKFNLTSELSNPKNLCFCKLPDHEIFQNFNTIGPSGESQENINGSAVAIECFLDLNSVSPKDRYVRWTSFNRKLARYQGECEGKDKIVRAFKKGNLNDGSYDVSMLEFLIDCLVSNWITKSA